MGVAYAYVASPRLHAYMLCTSAYNRRVHAHAFMLRECAGDRPGPHHHAQAWPVLAADDAGRALHPPGPPLLPYHTGKDQGALGRPGMVPVNAPVRARIIVGRGP